MTLDRRVALVGAALLAVGLTGCVPEPAASPAATSAAASTAPSAAPAPTASAAGDDISLPATCESIYPAATLADLTAQNPPLNDPGVTIFATQNAGALETLQSGIATIRCTWGAPGTKGLATNVSIVTPAQSRSVQDALAASGFACADADGGTVCTTEKQVLDLDDKVVTTGESHLFRGNAWVATAYVDFLPDGYTAAIAQALWR